MLRKTAKSMAALVMAFLFLCGCTHNREESVNTQQDIAQEYFGTESVSGDKTSEGGEDSHSSSSSVPDGAGGTSDSSDQSVEETGNIFIYVCGAVKEPGVYVLPEGSRVYEAIQMAGGEETEEYSAGKGTGELPTKPNKRGRSRESTGEGIPNIDSENDPKS